MGNFFFENRIKGKVKVITFVKIRQWAITFEPEVTETSGWFQNVPYRIPFLREMPRFDYDVTFLRHVTLINSMKIT